jgi:antitoxin YefM
MVTHAPTKAPKSMDIAEAAKRLSTFDQQLKTRPVIWVTRKRKRAFAVVDQEYLENLLETMSILSDPEMMKQIHASLEDIKAGRLIDHEEVKRLLG